MMNPNGLMGKMLNQALTNKIGEYDVARIIGHGFAGLCGLVFLGLAIYDTWLKKSFDYGGFAMGASAIGAVVLAAAAGVRVKDTAENQDFSNTTPSKEEIK